MRELLLIAGAAMIASPVMAFDWDENIDGDLSDFESAPTVLSLTLGDNIISGTIGGPSATSPPDDFFDALAFTMAAGWQVDAAILLSYGTSGGNTTSGFNVYNSLDGTNFIGTDLFSDAAVGTDLLDIATGGTMGAGDWTIGIREGTVGQTYSFNLVVTPAPASAGLLGLGGLVLARRRR